MNNHTIPIDKNNDDLTNPIYILSLLNNEIMSSSWKLFEKNYSIGRSSECDIILDDITVSRRHAYLKVSNRNIEIVDNNSTNGIYVNDTPGESFKIISGDKIQIGKYLFLITKV